MRLRISREELRSRSLYIATPVYGGQPFGHFAAALDLLKLTMLREQLTFDDRQIFNESLVPRARNYLAHHYRQSGMTHMLFIDADIEFRPYDALLMLALADPESDKDIICGAYPKKTIAWKKIAAAVRAGFADEDLENFAGEFFFSPVDSTVPHDLGEPIEVTEAGTGFMMIQRRVFDRFIEQYPELLYVDDNTGEEMACFFNGEVVGKRYLSEDFNFCRLVRAMGMKVWLLPKVNLVHIGCYRFVGNIEAMAALSAAKEA